ncbi:MAG: phosphohistidine phosphatase SixA [Chloroflexota bacterium]
MKLYLIRHGQAVDHAATDSLRPLTEKGNRQARDVGMVLQRLGVQPAYIFASPRVRAQETAQHIGTALGVDITTEDACNFDFDISKALRLATQGAGEDVICVGHNPSMSEVSSQLASARINMKTGTVVCISLHGSHGMLEFVMPAKLAKAIAGHTDG